MQRRWVLVLAVMLAACGVRADPVAGPSPTASPTAPASSVRLAPLPTSPGPDTVPFHLNVTNQSFGIPDVRLVIELDGHAIIDQVFAVEDQHNWVRHDLHVEPGVHDITVTAPEHGVDMSESFTLEDQHWAVVSFWLGEEDASRPFSWSFSDEELLPM